MAAALGKGGTNALLRKPETVDEHLAVAGGVEVKLLADDGVVNLGEEVGVSSIFCVSTLWCVQNLRR